jgi:hypothetical protein
MTNEEKQRAAVESLKHGAYAIGALAFNNIETAQYHTDEAKRLAELVTADVAA